MHKSSETIQSLINEEHPSQQIFAIFSWGFAATKWVSKVLNSHPEIFCVHALNAYIEKHYNIKPRPNGLHYIKFIANKGAEYLLSGDIHGVHLKYLHEIQQFFGDKFNYAIITRDPIPRLVSHLYVFERYKMFKTWDLSNINEVMHKYDISLPKDDYEHRFFIYAVNMLNSIIEENKSGNIFKMEDLTQDSSNFERLVKILSGNKIKISKKWIKTISRIKKINVHNNKQIQINLSKWQQKIISIVVEEEAWKLYKDLGYEIS